MADPKGFMTTPRETPTRRPVDLRLLDWHEVYEPFPPSRLERQAGRCMDCGIPFCHHGCPLGNLIPEWNDLVLAARLAGGRRPAARHQQLPRVHRAALPSAVRSRLCARDRGAAEDRGRSRHDQAGRGGDHRPGLRVRLGGAPAPGGPVRPFGGGDRLGPGRARGGSAADPGRSRGHRVRARRRARRPAALRHSRVQAGEAARGPAAGPDAGRGHRIPLWRRSGHRRFRGNAARLL